MPLCNLAPKFRNGCWWYLLCFTALWSARRFCPFQKERNRDGILQNPLPRLHGDKDRAYWSSCPSCRLAGWNTPEVPSLARGNACAGCSGWTGKFAQAGDPAGIPTDPSTPIQDRSHLIGWSTTHTVQSACTQQPHRRSQTSNAESFASFAPLICD